MRGGLTLSAVCAECRVAPTCIKSMRGRSGCASKRELRWKHTQMERDFLVCSLPNSFYMLDLLLSLLRVLALIVFEQWCLSELWNLGGKHQLQGWRKGRRTRSSVRGRGQKCGDEPDAFHWAFTPRASQSTHADPCGSARGNDLCREKSTNLHQRYDTGVRVTFEQMLWQWLLPMRQGMGRCYTDAADQQE